MTDMSPYNSSISSSPLADVTTATLTYSVLNAPSLSGEGNQHVGVASTYLSGLVAGDKLHVAVRPSNSAFRLPIDSANTPIICIAAGSGLAPFRGFIQERAAMIVAGRKLAPALLFFGCRSPDQDDLYAEELSRWEALGAVEVRRAYSRDADKSLGCKYVQHRIDHDREDVTKLWDAGAMVYICGSREVGKAVEETFVRMAVDRKTETHPEGLDEGAARAWFEKLRNERYATDVFD
jgi:cytochrome P450/NADPH-cytochrome P450 reductase